MEIGELTVTLRYKVRCFFAWFALVGTWTVAIIIALMSTMCCAPALGTVPTEHAAMSRAVQIYVVCADFSKFIAGVPGGIDVDTQRGSGVITDHHRILTASHVPKCDGGKQPIAFAKFGASWVMTSEARSYMPERDIASMYIAQDTGFGPIEFRRSVMEHESVCAAFPYPMAHYDCGSFKKYEHDNDGVNGRIAIPVVPGNSGSPLLDREGRLVGLVTATYLCHPMMTVTLTDGVVSVKVTQTGGTDCDGAASMLDATVTP